jgi:hypothetical protein
MGKDKKGADADAGADDSEHVRVVVPWVELLTQLTRARMHRGAQPGGDDDEGPQTEAPEGSTGDGAEEGAERDGQSSNAGPESGDGEAAPDADAAAAAAAAAAEEAQDDDDDDAEAKEEWVEKVVTKRLRLRTTWTAGGLPPLPAAARVAARDRAAALDAAHRRRTEHSEAVNGLESLIYRAGEFAKDKQAATYTSAEERAAYVLGVVGGGGRTACGLTVCVSLCVGVCGGGGRRLKEAVGSAQAWLAEAGDSAPTEDYRERSNPIKARASAILCG